MRSGLRKADRECDRIESIDIAGRSRKGKDEMLVVRKERMRMEVGMMERGVLEGAWPAFDKGRNGTAGASETDLTAY